ncbi:hypothetical protein HMSSN036_57890 [Paenibacillus macerans]|nr:hypothetical protein HMSSN036_57890 [Paenibacillus macerans]
MRVRFMAEKLEINLTYALEEECIRWIVECKTGRTGVFGSRGCIFGLRSLT